MRGDTDLISITRRAGRNLSSTTTGPYSARIQPASLEVSFGEGAEQMVAELSCAPTVPLKEDDLVQWNGRTWRARQVLTTAGRGSTKRAILTSERQ